MDLATAFLVFFVKRKLSVIFYIMNILDMQDICNKELQSTLIWNC